MKVSIEKGELVVRIPLKDEPTESSSGKNMVIASTGGNTKSGFHIPSGPGKGKEVVIGLNAYYKP